ncbi:MAG: zinc dependent phospholipase C family protein [Blautia sp.]|nr:zinc dependent phospholipase C family protein [Blautia sp.]
MPTTYTHDYFGKRVYHHLPPEVKQIVRESGDLYRIGLHGPDILFYFMLSKNPVTSHGVKMHNERADAFFERNIDLIRKNHDRELLAYLLGFACHYMLDSASHPYINELAGRNVISHTLLEKELDRYLMEATGKDPHSYRPSDAVHPRVEYARVIHRAIPAISTRNIYLTMKWMKFITNHMICRKGGKKREIYYSIARMAGKKNADRLADYFMRQTAAKEAEIPVRRLVHIFNETVPEAAYELNILYQMAVSDEETRLRLSERWHMDYRGLKD